MAKPSIALLLTLLDDAYYLPEWCECVRRIAPDEVVVVDGGSNDGGPEFLQRQGLPNFRLIRRSMEEVDWHYSRQLNFATAHTQGDWIVLLDADEVLWPPERAALERAIQQAGAAVVSLWFGRLHLWPNDRVQLDWGSNLDPQPRFWKRDAGIRWTQKVHNRQTLDGEIVTCDHRRAQLLESPIILHRKLTAPHPLRLARHRRWLEHWAEASAAFGLPIPEEMPDDHGPTLPLPGDVSNWRETLMGRTGS